MRKTLLFSAAALACAWCGASLAQEEDDGGAPSQWEYHVRWAAPASGEDGELLHRSPEELAQEVARDLARHLEEAAAKGWSCFAVSPDPRGFTMLYFRRPRT